MKFPLYSSNKSIDIKTFGDIEVCLPNVQGMVECYENEDIKSYVSNFDFEVNQIIGFYLTQNDYDNFNSSDKPKMDGYLKIYSPKKMKNQEINNSNLDEMVQIFKKNFLESNWDKISEKIEELGTNLRIDSPILMENYKPNETTRTFITFNKIASETYEDFQISALNLMNIKNRLIAEGIKDAICESCGIGENWNGKDLVLELDHIDGNNTNNSLENLRILCPNCHSQTPTFRGRNIKK